MNRIMNLRTQPVWREAKDYVFIALGMMMYYRMTFLREPFRVSPLLSIGRQGSRYSTHIWGLTVCCCYWL